MNAPLVSIIINNYNYGRFLARAIDSALQQSYAATEVIVVDDGSTDGSADIINRYENRIIVCPKENGGQGSAFNAGFFLSQGQVVCFLDADDELLPNAIEQAIRLFNNPTVVHVHWPLHSVNAQGQSLGETIPYQALSEGSLCDAMIQKGIAGYVSSPASGNAWARHYLQQVLPMPEAPYPVAADSYVAMLAPLFGETRRLEQPHSLHRVHGHNSTFTRPYEQTLKLMDYRLELLAKVMQEQAILLTDEPRQWRSHDAYYQYVLRMVAIGKDLARYISPGKDYILIDLSHWSKGELLTHSRSIPFLEKDGLYWGPPETDEQAIAEFERLRQAGAHYLVFAEPAFWWIDHYTLFYQHLNAHYCCLSRNDERIVFDCSKKTGSTEIYSARRSNKMISERLNPERPVVTVAMPTYNRADLLQNSLQSVLNQDYPALQIVVIDNASPDHTRAVVESFADSRITYLCHSSNIGLFRNWQSAIALAKNPYLTILQDDDIMLPGFISASVAALEQSPQAGFSISQVKGINSQGESVPLPDDPPPVGNVLGLDYLEGMAAGKNWVIHASSVMMRSKTLLSVGKFDNPHSKHSIDLNLYMRLAAQSDLVFIPQILSHIRIHEGQDTQLRFRNKSTADKGTGPLAAIAERMDAVAYLLKSSRAQDAAYRQWLSERLLHMSAHRSALTAEFIPSLNLSWEEQLQVAVQELEALVPAGDRFVLADEDQWRLKLPETLESVPFTEKNGQYDGVPADDDTAISELQRLQQAGATYFIVGWPAFWWLDYYAGLRTYLASKFRCVLNNSRLIVFNLQEELI